MSSDENRPNRQIAQAEAALQAWDLGSIQSVTPVSGGLIHATFRVVSHQGTFCLQALHPKLATDEILSDWEAVCHHLAAKGLAAPRPRPTKRTSRSWTEASGRRWRLATWLQGETLQAIVQPHQARQAAALFGRFYQAMRDIPYEFQSSHPLHDTAFHLKALEAALDRMTQAGRRWDAATDRDDKLGWAGEGDPTGELDWAGEVEALGRSCIEAGRRLSLPGHLPRWIVHGDPKITNLLFRNGEAFAVLDMDTCGPHSILVDLGDALRSWAMAGPEDDSRGVRLDVVEEALAGWAEAGLQLTQDELALLPDAPAVITWELASRFTRDVIEDTYFGWDATKYPSRRAHNLARARSMASLAGAFEAHRQDLATMVGRIFGEGGNS